MYSDSRSWTTSAAGVFGGIISSAACAFASFPKHVEHLGNLLMPSLISGDDQFAVKSPHSHSGVRIRRDGALDQGDQLRHSRIVALLGGDLEISDLSAELIALVV